MKQPAKTRGAKLSLKELRNGDEIHFTPITKEYGRAEFSFCPVWEDGRFLELWIYPLTLPDAKQRWVVRAAGRQAFMVNSWIHKGMGLPWHWIFYWCEEHKCMAFRSYAPDEATKFTVHMIGNDLSIYFDK